MLKTNKNNKKKYRQVGTALLYIIKCRMGHCGLDVLNLN